MPGHARADFDDSWKPFASHRSALRSVGWRSVWHARRLIAGLAIGAALLPLPVIAAADGPGTLLPVEDFARPPDFTQLKLSPDGHYVAFLREHAGRDTLYFAELPSLKAKRVNPGTIQGLRKEVVSFRWVSDERIAFATAVWDRYVTGVSAVDRTGNNWKALTGPDADRERPLVALDIIHAFEDRDGHILMLDRKNNAGVNILHPDVVKVNSRTGTIRTVAENPGTVTSWRMDRNGVVRLGFTREDGKRELLYRENDDAPWQTLQSPKGKKVVRVVGFDDTNSQFYLAALSDEGRYAIHPYDPASGELGDAVFFDPDYDFALESSLVPTIDGIPLVQVIFSRTGRLLGAAHVREIPKTIWVDADFAARQKALDQALPKRINLMTSLTRDEQRMLVLSYSDRDPGTYYLFDAKKKSLGKIAERMPWIKTEQMAPMYATKYQARDGETIHGYLTVPVGRTTKNLPLVVMPHGGPWVRDIWGFNPLVQFLANRGYAVLQMNFRGSPGYGEAFYRAGRRQIGRAIQNDVEDAARWAIEKGIADPQRVAIVGGSFGGYCALFGLAQSPGLYQCGVSISGVTDWLAIYHALDDEEYKFARQHWIREIGNPEDDAEFLASISPVNLAEKVTAPVLLMHGKDDHIVPLKQARAMASALERAGRSAEVWYASGEGHRFSSAKARTELFGRIEGFLARHMKTDTL